jgi:hypothetical protein
MLIHWFEISRSFTYGRTDKPEESDFSKRELIREAALRDFPSNVPPVDVWGFNIVVYRNLAKKGQFDIENVPKLIIDAFCGQQFKKWDKLSKYRHLALYPNDSIDIVRLLTVRGERIDGTDRMRIEIHGWSNSEPLEF